MFAVRYPSSLSAAINFFSAWRISSAFAGIPNLIPIFSDVIPPNPEITNLINKVRDPFEKECNRIVGETETLLYRRGNFNGTWDDIICNSIMQERDTEISLSPGFRWGTTILPGQKITIDDIYSQTAMNYPEVYRTEMTGKMIKELLEDVCDNIFNPDPFFQQGGDMVRIGGMSYKIDINKPQGSRITDMTLLKTGEKIDPSKTYIVSGWASVNEATEGPQIWDVVESYIRRHGSISIEPNSSVEVVGI